MSAREPAARRKITWQYPSEAATVFPMATSQLYQEQPTAPVLGWSSLLSQPWGKHPVPQDATISSDRLSGAPSLFTTISSDSLSGAPSLFTAISSDSLSGAPSLFTTISPKSLHYYQLRQSVWRSKSLHYYQL